MEGHLQETCSNAHTEITNDTEGNWSMRGAIRISRNIMIKELPGTCEVGDWRDGERTCNPTKNDFRLKRKKSSRRTYMDLVSLSE